MLCTHSLPTLRSMDPDHCQSMEGIERAVGIRIDMLCKGKIEVDAEGCDGSLATDPLHRGVRAWCNHLANSSINDAVRSPPMFGRTGAEWVQTHCLLSRAEGGSFTCLLQRHATMGFAQLTLLKVLVAVYG